MESRSGSLEHVKGVGDGVVVVVDVVEVGVVVAVLVAVVAAVVVCVLTAHPSNVPSWYWLRRPLSVLTIASHSSFAVKYPPTLQPTSPGLSSTVPISRMPFKPAAMAGQSIGRALVSVLLPVR